MFFGGAMIAARNGAKMAVDCVGRYYFHKTDNNYHLNSMAFQSLPADSVGIYFRSRLLAGNMNNNGSLSLDGIRKLKEQEYIGWIALLPGIAPKRRARAIFNELINARMIKVSRAGIVSIYGWAKEQEIARTADAAKKRRVRNKAQAREIALRFFSCRGFVASAAKSCWTAMDEGGLIADDFNSPVPVSVVESSCLSYIEVSSLSPSAPPQGSGFSGFQGEDMSPRKGGTCPPYRPETETETKKQIISNLNPDTEQRASAISQGSGVQGSGDQGGGAEGESEVWDTLDLPGLACRLCGELGEPGSLPRNSWTKKLGMLREALGPNQGEEAFRHSLMLLKQYIREGNVKKARSCLLHGFLNKRIAGGAP